jgi:AmmeMemoRadiSam system protein B
MGRTVATPVVPVKVRVPVVLATDRYGAMEELGRAVAHVVKAQSEPVLVIASSDMNHYESDAVTRLKDGRASDRACPGARSARALQYGSKRGNYDVRIRGHRGDTRLRA